MNVHCRRDFHGVTFIAEETFCKILETVELETDDGEDDGEYEDGGAQVHESGSSLIVRYRIVKDLIEQGRVVLMY